MMSEDNNTPSQLDLQESESRESVVSLEETTPKFPADNKSREGLWTFFLFAGVIALFLIFVDYSKWTEDRNSVSYYYEFYVDVSIMVFIGFGFLMTFLKKYGLGAVGFTYLVSAFVVLWAVLVFGLARSIAENTLNQKISLSIRLLINAQFVAAAVMITFGGLIGKISSGAMLLLAFFETIFYAINYYIIVFRLQALDVGGTMAIHVFGAYFGLSATKVLTPAESKGHPNNATRYNSDIFSLIGTVFLFLYWPSFNAATTLPEFRTRAVMNTVISIMGATVGTFLLSRILRGEGKFGAVDIQNATLAGGVAIGSCANLVVLPGAALAIGFVAGLLSTYGFNKVQSWLQDHFDLWDSCGINNLHGMPGVFGGVVAAIVAGISEPADFEDKWDALFPHGAAVQGGINLASLLITLGIAIISGNVCARIVKALVKSPRLLFSDADEWHVEGFEREPHTHAHSNELKHLHQK